MRFVNQLIKELAYIFRIEPNYLPLFVAFIFQCYRGGIVEPGIGLNVGGDTFHSAAKTGLLYDSRHWHRSGTSENRLELSRIRGWANSEKVGCSCMLFALFFPILDLYLELLRNEIVLHQNKEHGTFVILTATLESTCLMEFSFHATREIMESHSIFDSSDS